MQGNKSPVLAPEDDSGAMEALRFSLASDIVELVVLTADDIFLQTLRGAVGPTRRLWHVPTSDKVSDLLIAGSVGILVLDVQAVQETGSRFIASMAVSVSVCMECRIPGNSLESAHRLQS